MARKSRNVASVAPAVAKVYVPEQAQETGPATDTAQQAEPIEQAEVTTPKPRASAPPLVKVDLGCGAIKRDGFIGVDRFPMPGVDIVCDISQGIPLDDDSVDYVIASHSLEHFSSLPQVMEEINRICKDRALITIIGPYYNTRLNQANPYHLQPFNEHTPRFFSTMPSPAVEVDEYAFPFANNWALGRSDNTDWVADFRLVHAEYLYMPAYRGLDPVTQRVLRKTWSDVCDQFSMQMLVVKSPISEEELAAFSARESWPSTPYYDARRQEELEIGPRNVLSRLFEEASATAEVEALRTAIAELAEHAGQITNLQARVEGLAIFANHSAQETSEAFQRLQANDAAAGRPAAWPSADMATSEDLTRALRRIEEVETIAADADLRTRKLGSIPDHIVELTEQSTDTRLAAARLSSRIDELEQMLLSGVLTGSPKIAARIASLDQTIEQRGGELEALRAETQSILSEHSDLERGLGRALHEIQALVERLEQVELAGQMVEPLSNSITQVAGELEEARDELEALPGRLMEKIKQQPKGGRDTAHDDLVAERITAINAAFTRRILALELKMEDLLGGGTQYADILHGDVARLKEREAALTDVVIKQSAYLETALTHVVGAQIAAERGMFRPLARIRSYIKRGRDARRDLAEGPFSTWLQDPLNTPGPEVRIQQGDYWMPGEGMTFDLGPVSAGFMGVDLAALAFMPPAFPVEAFAFEIADADGKPVAHGRAEADKDLGLHCPLRLRFTPLEHAQANVTVRLHGLQHLSRIGIKFYERRHLQPMTRRIIQKRPLVVPVYG